MSPTFDAISSLYNYAVACSRIVIIEQILLEI
jgi:hypothetical protein